MKTNKIIRLPSSMISWAFFILIMAPAIIQAQNTTLDQTTEDINSIVQDPEAKVILDQVAAKAKSSVSISFNFNYVMESSQDNSKFTQTGQAVLKGNKYKIKLEDSEISFDGKSIYNYIPYAKEVTVTTPDASYDEFFLSNPTAIFTLYQKDFKYRIYAEGVLLGKQCWEIHLFPMNLNHTYSRIVLYIDKSNYEIVSVRLMGKMGDKYTIDLNSYLYNKPFDDSYFTFTSTSHPGVQVIDMRGTE